MPVPSTRPLTNDQKALAERFVGYARALAATASKRRGFRADRYDATVSTVLYTLTIAARNYVPGGRASFKTYLIRCVECQLLPKQTVNPLPTPLSQLPEMEEPGYYEPQWFDRPAMETGEILHQLRERLPRKMFDLLWSHYVLGDSVDTLAKDLRVSRERVRAKLITALERAREAMQREKSDRRP